MSDLDENYGPLAQLIGSWKGDKGLDLAPEPDGEEREAYYETIEFEGIGDVNNAEEQVLYALHYHLEVYRKRDDKMIHNQSGYWLWCAESNTVMHSFTIPRGVCVLAGGKFDGSLDDVKLEVSSSLGDEEWGIIQSPFILKKATTLGFSQTLRVAGDEMSYEQTTKLDIYGRKFDHTDRNTLNRQ